MAKEGLKATLDAKKGRLILDIPLEDDPQPSSTGKSILVAKSGGWKATDVKINGKLVSVNYNCAIPVR